MTRRDFYHDEYRQAVRKQTQDAIISALLVLVIAGLIVGFFYGLAELGVWLVQNGWSW